MPSQDLDYAPPRLPTGAAGSAVCSRASSCFARSWALPSTASIRCSKSCASPSMTLLQGLMIFFFAVSLAWIAFAAGSVHCRRLEAPRSPPRTGGGRPGGRRHAARCRRSPRWSCRSTTRIPFAPPRRCKPWPRRCRRPARVVLSRSWCFQIRPTPMRGSARPRPSSGCARALAGISAGLVPAALAQRRAQVGQHRGFRHAMGRPLRSHDRARCRQSDRSAPP